MASFRIISTPRGEAPERVRQQWVGLILPMSYPPLDTAEVGVLSEETISWNRKNDQGFWVATETAYAILDAQRPEAAAWWRSNVSPEDISWLKFERECCRRMREPHH